MSNYRYAVCVYNSRNKMFEEQKSFENLQQARKFAKEIADNVRYGFLSLKEKAIHIYKIDKTIERAVAVYFN